MTLVDWARHGENVANLSRTMSHRVFDGDLTDRGRDQAHALGTRLAAGSTPYGVLVTSPLRRAVQTADIVASHLGRSGADLVVEDFREIDCGELDGRADADAWAVHDDVLQAWIDGDHTVRFPGGENAEELAARVARGLRTVAARTAAGTAALVVAHGGNVRFAQPGLAGVPPPAPELGNAELARLRVSSHRFELLAWPLG